MQESSTVLTLFALAAAWAVFAVAFAYAGITVAVINRLGRDHKETADSVRELRKDLLRTIIDNEKETESDVAAFHRAFARNPRAFAVTDEERNTTRTKIEEDIRAAHARARNELMGKIDDIFGKMEEEAKQQLRAIENKTGTAMVFIGFLAVVSVGLSAYFILFG